MAKLSRREFLRMAAAGLGAMAVQQLAIGCQRLSTPPPSPGQPGETPQAPSARTEAPQPAPPTMSEASQESPVASAAAGYPDLVVARRGEPEEMVRRALAALGGMERFVPQEI